ncbi:hypothetical protein LTR82_012057 [Friedmanniomyces endolithicus]|uniref:Major facilitator superfamily (MFS) profile domain-containing protein n=1 Tax=Friedmanniomyces endolithicus TaxID=329885 RepID=A0AAN6FEB0_9PEZI|nr:hypothetical protein LTR82_012057 [Friedmanniomyces endolithicus]
MSIEMLAPITLDAKLRPSEEDLMNPMQGSGGMGSMDGKHEETTMASEMLSHPMHADDPHNPMNFPLHRKIFISFTAWLFAATVAFGATCFTAGKAQFVQDFNIGNGVPLSFIAGLSLYLWGIAFAPIWTPHVAERTGRSIIYLVALPYFNVILIAVVFIFSLGQSETYQREIPRRHAHKHNKSRKEFCETQDPALSGVTIGQMLKITVLDAFLGPFTDLIVALSTLFLLFNFAVVFQWFISVPAALGTPPPMGPGYTIDRIGLAIGLTGMIGATCAALTSITIEQVSLRMFKKKSETPVSLPIEHRLIPAMIGQFFITTALFWIGATVSPKFSPLVPIVGTAVYIFGNVSIIISVIPYLFDAFPPAGTLSALTSAASARILFASAMPMVILYDITALTPLWAFGVFGFISVAMWPIPFLLFRYGPTWRAQSRYTKVATNIIDGRETRGKMPSRDSETTAYKNGMMGA